MQPVGLIGLVRRSRPTVDYESKLNSPPPELHRYATLDRKVARSIWCSACRLRERELERKPGMASWSRSTRSISADSAISGSNRRRSLYAAADLRSEAIRLESSPASSIAETTVC